MFRRSASTLVVVAGFALSAFAQSPEGAQTPTGPQGGDRAGTPNGPNGPNGNGQQQGQRRQGDRGNRGNRGQTRGNNGPNNGGPSNGGPNGQAGNWTPERCQAEATSLPNQAAECLKVSEFNARKGCFETIGNSKPQGFFDSCRTAVEPIKQQIMAQEKSLYPNQASAVDGPNGNNNQANNNSPNNGPNNGRSNRGRNNRGGPNNGPNDGGSNNGPNGPAGNWTPERCQAEATSLPNQAAECLKVSDFNARRGCFEAIGNTKPRDFFENCRATVDPIKQQVMAQEKSLYPNQASAVDGPSGGGKNNQGNNGPNNGRGNRGRGGPNNGPNNGGPNNQANQWTPEKCQEKIPELTQQATECLKNSNFVDRRNCFDRIGSGLPQGFEACQAQTNPVKAQIQAQEKALYPDQASAVDGSNGGNQGQQANNGPNNGRNNRGRNGGRGGPNNGPNNGGPNGQAGNWTPERCQTESTSLPNQTAECLKVSDFNARKGCFDTIGNSKPQGFFDNCRAAVEPLKQQVMAQEKSLYPNQASALDGGKGGNQGPNNNQAMSQKGNGRHGGDRRLPANTSRPDMANMDCGKLSSEVKNEAMKCLSSPRNAKFESRKKCFAGVGTRIQRSGKGDSCKDTLDSLKNEVTATEKQKYPDQESAL